MNGTVTGWKKQYSPKHEREYIMLFIKLHNAERNSSVLYLDPTNRNYSRWVPFFQRGTQLTNLVMLKSGNVDGDSPVELLHDPQQQLNLFDS